MVSKRTTWGYDRLTRVLGRGLDDFTCVLLSLSVSTSCVADPMSDLLGDGLGDGREVRVRFSDSVSGLTIRFDGFDLLGSGLADLSDGSGTTIRLGVVGFRVLMTKSGRGDLSHGGDEDDRESHCKSGE
jgi:hypothetical protein